MTEGQEQEIIFKWADLQTAIMPELKLLNGSLNGVKLSIGSAMKAKRQGMRKGYPDIALPIARAGYHGLFIELKKDKGGRPSKEQKEWLAELNRQGYLALCIHGSKLSIDVIKMYLRGDSVGLSRLIAIK